MKTHIKKAFIFIFFFTLIIGMSVKAYGITLNQEEKKYLEDNRNRKFILGVDPYSGMEYFTYNSKENGYLIPLMDYISKDLGIKIEIDGKRSWSEIYPDLKKGGIDILFAANETEERKKFMAFTKPVSKNPYAIITQKGSSIKTIGDLDNKKVGFLKEDIIIEMLPQVYKNIKYDKSFYNSKEEGILAVKNGEINAFITVGGAVVYDYIYTYPQLDYVFKISKITSDLTLSTRKEDQILAGIIDKEIDSIRDTKLKDILRESEIQYYRKIMNLTPEELNWLKNDGKAVVGVTKDYLPFDYYHDGKYLGIGGEVIKEIENKTGIKFTFDYDEFDSLNEKLKTGKIDILNIAKTEDRLKYIIYPRCFSNERDIIVGRKDSYDVRDIFGLEGKRVAVIKGFWHKEYLEKNLTDVDIIETNSIQESLKLVNEGKADYLIENPTVVRYYIDELELYDLCEKGVTSSDSYLYYGVYKGDPYLASIIDKVIPLLDIDDLSRTGYLEIPHKDNKIYEKKLIYVITVMGIALMMVLLILLIINKNLSKERINLKKLREREELLYTDTLTNVKNRNHYITNIRNTLDKQPYPQSLIIADMNNLKTVNDKYGHQLGDQLLKIFSKSLMECCPKDSYIYRMGGDEFCIILFRNDESSAERIITSIRKYLNKNGINIGEEERILASVAFGYSIRENSLKSIEDAEKEADGRMYEDKMNIKNG